MVSVNLFNALSYPWKEQLIFIFFLYQLKLMLKFVCFCVDVGIGHSFDVGVCLGVFCVGVFVVSIGVSWVT